MHWLKSILTIFLLALSLAVSAAAAADPTLHEIYQAAESGDLKKAQSMVDQVLRDHPNSAKAHFVQAELLVREGRVDMARAELGTAERLAPGLPFAKPDSVSALTQRLQPVAHSAPVVLQTSSAPLPDFPWMRLIGGGLLLAAFIFFLRSMNRPQIVPAPAGGYGVAGNGFGGGYPQPVGMGGMGPVPSAPGGIGSGILGGLATGAAVGAGMVAGEALMHKVLGGGQTHDHLADQSGFQPIDSYQPIDNNFDMGGSDFGVSDNGSWDSSGGGSGDEW